MGHLKKSSQKINSEWKLEHFIIARLPPLHKAESTGNPPEKGAFSGKATGEARKGLQKGGGSAIISQNVPAVRGAVPFGAGKEPLEVVP